MNKELEALKEARKFRHEKDKNLVVIDIDYYDQCLDGIETALKENDELKRMIRNFNEAIGEPMIITPSIENKLKALKIIKEKGIDTEMFYQFETYEDYQEFCENSETFRNLYGDYTREDFDLLKEALK